MSDTEAPSTSAISAACSSAIVNCPACGQHVEFKFHRPVRTTAEATDTVQVEELAEVAYRALHIEGWMEDNDQTWADVMAHSYDRTRDLCIKAAAACCAAFDVRKR